MLPEVTLELVSAPGFFESLSRSTTDLTTKLTAAAGKAGVEFSAASLGGMFGLFFRPTAPTNYAEVLAGDKERFNRFFHAMLKRGVYLAPSAFEAGFVSAAHSTADIDATVSAATLAFAEC